MGMNVNAASELKDYGNEEKLNCWRCCLLHCALIPTESHLKPCRVGRDVLGGPGWWSLLPKHPRAAAMTQLPASRCPATTDPSVPTKEQWLFPLTGQDVTPRCRAGTPVPPPWQQQTPWGFPKELPPTLLHIVVRALTAFFPPSVSPGKEKRNLK